MPPWCQRKLPPTMNWIAPRKKLFGRPVITTNQAAIWAVLKAMRIETPLPDRGRLFAELPKG
jgi:maleate isomerase